MRTIEPNALHRAFVAAVAAAGLAGQLAWANPVGPVVVNGQISFETRGKVLSVTNSPGSIINWQQFSIGASETTRFIQPSAASAVLNRVVGADPSRILGSLQSNGRVFVINPSGIVFGPHSQIDVAGLVASTLNLSNTDFISGRLSFAGDPARAAAVVNQGRITAGQGGRIYLVGSAVDNQGVITAPNGDIVLAAGKSVRVAERASTGVQVEITAPIDRALNLSEFAYGPRGVYAGLVRNSGSINADSAVRGADGSLTLKASKGVKLESGSRLSANGPDGGRIVIDAQQGAAAVSGSIEAAGSSGRGGSVAIGGEQAGLLDGASVDASGASAGGTVLIGGDLRGASIRDGDSVLANSQSTYVAPSAQIRADARESGNGGRVVVWADKGTGFYGSISARGGAGGGNGGSVEVSGKETLVFKGNVDTRAPRGTTGTLLLDPADITIMDGTSDGDDADAVSNSFFGGPSGTTGAVLSTDGTPTILFQSELEGIAAATNISLAATNSITINDLTSNNLNLAQSAGRSVSFQSGTFSMDPGDTITTAGGALNITTTTGGAAIGSLASNGGAVVLNLAGPSTVAGAISGAATSLTKQGAGTLTLNGGSTYGGATTVSAGTLVLGTSNVLSSSTAVTVNGTGTLDIATANQTVAGVQLVAGSITGATGTLTSTAAYDLQSGTVSAILGGAVGLNKSTAGTVTLSGANTYTGATAVNAGVLNLQNATAAGTTAGGVTVASGAALELQGGITVGNESLSITGTGVGGNGALRNISGDNTWGGTVTLTGGGATIQSDANTLTLNAVTGAAQDLTFAGAGNGLINGAITTTSGTVTKAGAGMVTLASANSYTGATAVNAGTLAVTADGALGTAAAGTSVASGATLDFQNVAYVTLEPLTLNGGTIAASTGTSSFANGVTMTAGSLASAGSGAQLTLLGVIGDGGSGSGLTKTGAGTLVLQAVQSYTGDTTVGGGTLVLGGDDRLQVSSNLFVNGGEFSMAGFNQTMAGVHLLSGSITGSGSMLTSTNTFDLQGGSASAILTGTVGATKTGAGTVTLSAANTYTGATTINAGVLSVSALANGGLASNIGQSSNAASNLVLGGGSLQYTGGSVSIDRNYTLSAGTTSSIDVSTAGATLTLTGSSAATNGVLTKLGSGTLALGASNLLADTTSLIVNGGTFDIGTFSDTVAGVRLLSGSITGTTGTLTSISTFDLQGGSASAILTGTVGATKTGAGTVTLSGANTYAGATTINAGVLSVSALANGGLPSNIGQSSNAAANLVLGGGTLQYTGGAVSIDRNYTLSAGTTSSIDVSTGGTNLTLTGVGAATNGSLTKIGSGTLTLTGANLYTGLTTVSAGTLAHGADNALASGPVTVSGGTWDISTFSDTVGVVTLVSGNINGTTGVITGTSYDVRSGSISAILAGGGPLTKTTSGTVTISGHNTYTGLTTVSAGTLALGASDTLDDATHVLVNGGTFDIAGFSDTVAGVRLDSGTITGTSGVLTSLSNFDLRAGTVSAIISGTVGVDKTTVGTVTLTRANTFTGATAVNGGTLVVTSNDALGTNPAGTTVESGATLDFQNVVYGTPEALTLHGGTVATSTGTSSFAGPVSLSADSTASVTGTKLTLTGVISDSGGTFGLTKIGAGTLVLSGNNTYKGTTRINAGTVALGANDRLDDVSRLVVNGGTFDILGFNDTVAGVQLLSGTITGGSGVLTSTSNYDLQSGVVSAIITGAVGLDKTTAGTVTLSRDNAYTGATAVSAGTLVVTAGNALGATGAGTTVTSGATLSIVNAAIVAEPVTLNGNGVGGVGALTGTGAASLAGSVTVNSASTIGVATAPDALTLSGVVEGPGALSLTGAGTLTFGNTVGAATPLASLTQSATTRLNVNGGLVRTSGDQTYNGSVTTGGATTLRTTANGNVSAPGANGVFHATAGTLTLDTGAGAATLTNVLNDFATVEVTSGGAVSLVDANSITIGNANLNAMTARALSGNLTLSGTATATGSGNSIVLVANGNFINTAGATALDPGPGRWLVYSTSPELDTRGGLAYGFKQYNATFLPATPVAQPAGNGFLYSIAPVLTPSLTGTVTKVYDATAAATLDSANYSFAGALDGDTVALNNSTSGIYDAPDVGSGRLVSVSGLSLAGASNGAATVYGYQLAGTSASANIGSITPAPLAITPNDQSKTYGQTFTFIGTEFTSSGLQGGQTIGSVSLASTGAPATAHVAGSPYAITGTAATGGTFTPGNYTIAYGTGQLTVAPAALTVTANDQTKAYGGSPFVFTGSEFTSSGLQNGDVIAGVTLASAGAAPTAAVAGSPYPITPSAATGVSFVPGDYAITYVNGQFTVNPAGVALTVIANNQTKTYGTTLSFSGTEFTATGLQNGETIGRVVLASPGAAATAHVSGNPYVIAVNSASGGTFAPGNYTITYVDGRLTVVPAPLTVRADDKSRLSGASNPPFSATYSGFQIGESPAVLTGALSISTPATTGSPAGIYAIVPSGQTATDYAITFENGALAVRQSGSVLAGLTAPLLAALEQLGIDDFNRDVSICLGEDMASSPAIAPKGLGAKPPRNCTPGVADEASQTRRRR